MKWLLFAGAGGFSLLIGSFLGMLVYRIPLMLQHQWRRECLSLFPTDSQQKYPVTTDINLFFPFSYCPACQSLLTLLQKIPLLGFCLLKGRCGYCKEKISAYYPCIEALTLISSLFLIGRFDFSLHLLAGLILTWGLLLLAFIDIQQRLLPDVLVLPLLWLGLALNTFSVFTSLKEAIWGAIFAYLSLWIFAKGYRFLTQREGMGQGDMKCFALLGAWLGISTLPIILLIASLLGSLLGLSLWVIKKANWHACLPFGPCLALAGWFVLLGRANLFLPYQNLSFVNG